MKCHVDLLQNLGDITALCEAAEAALESRKPSDRICANAMTRSGWVLLCGYFEGFIRDLMEESINKINDNNIDINIVPGGLFCSLFEGLSNKHKQMGDSTLIPFKEAIRNGSTHKFNAKILSKTGGNPTVDTIEELLKKIGIDLAIDKLTLMDFKVSNTFIFENQAEPLRENIQKACKKFSATNSDTLIEEILGVVNGNWQPRKKRRDVGYVALIQELLKKRNRIAHGEGRDSITPLELTEYKDGIARLCTGLKSLADDALNQLMPLVQPPAIQSLSTSII